MILRYHALESLAVQWSLERMGAGWATSYSVGFCSILLEQVELGVVGGGENVFLVFFLLFFGGVRFGGVVF